MNPSPFLIDRSALAAAQRRETQRFLHTHPRSVALAGGDIACMLTEPALTNCGLVPPRPGYLAQLQSSCRRHGALFVLDETHRVSSGCGGHAWGEGLAPDLLVLGKAIAGGMPCAVYGFTDDLNARMEACKRAAPDGHSGIGTTLSASLVAMAALHASLTEVMTPAPYATILASAAATKRRLRETLRNAGVPWTVTRLGARMELQFCHEAPRQGRQARAGVAPDGRERCRPDARCAGRVHRGGACVNFGGCRATAALDRPSDFTIRKARFASRNEALLQCRNLSHCGGSSFVSWYT